MKSEPWNSWVTVLGLFSLEFGKRDRACETEIKGEPRNIRVLERFSLECGKRDRA